jgi:hypothetical protein
VKPLAESFERLRAATDRIAQAGAADPDEVGAAATDYLRLFGLTALAYMWARAADVALPKSRNGGDPDGFYKAKVGTARFFMERILPQSTGLFGAIMAGGRSMMEFDEAAL